MRLIMLQIWGIPFHLLFYIDLVKQLWLGQEGLHTSLKPEEAFIYFYDGCMVEMSEFGSVQAMANLYASYGVLLMVPPTDACEDNPSIQPS